MRLLRYVATAALCASIVTPVALANGRNPGSMLIYPVHRSGPEYFTVISVTNTNTQPANQVQLGGTTFVHYEYVNTVPDDYDPCLTKSCTVHNDTEILTPADTLSLLTTCHNAEDPEGNEGFVVLTAQDPSSFNQNYAFNYLVGSELVVNSSGGVYSINAIPFEGLSPASNFNKKLNGAEYECAPDRLIIDNFVGISRSHLTLLNLTGGLDDVNTLYFQAWNDNEQPMSATKDMGCWFDQPLENVAEMFSQIHLLGTGHDPAELDLNCNGIGTIETGWSFIDSIRVENAGGGFVDDDGVILGAITSGVTSTIDGGRLLWESYEKQCNGEVFGF